MSGSASKIKRAYATPLAPCPFCGSEAVLNEHIHQRRAPAGGVSAGEYVGFYVICADPDCGCSLRHTLSPKNAVKAWNRRLLRLTAVTAAPQADVK